MNRARIFSHDSLPHAYDITNRANEVTKRANDITKRANEVTKRARKSSHETLPHEVTFRTWRV